MALLFHALTLASSMSDGGTLELRGGFTTPCGIRVLHPLPVTVNRPYTAAASHLRMLGVVPPPSPLAVAVAYTSHVLSQFSQQQLAGFIVALASAVVGMVVMRIARARAQEEAARQLAGWPPIEDTLTAFGEALIRLDLHARLDAENARLEAEIAERLASASPLVALRRLSEDVRRLGSLKGQAVAMLNRARDKSQLAGAAWA